MAVFKEAIKNAAIAAQKGPAKGSHAVPGGG